MDQREAARHAGTTRPLDGSPASPALVPTRRHPAPTLPVARVTTVHGAAPESVRLRLVALSGASCTGPVAGGQDSDPQGIG